MLKSKLLPSITVAIALASFALVGLSPSTARADGYFNCTPDRVMERNNRVDVHCTNSWAAGTNQITYLAIDKSDEKKMRRFIAFANSALLGKKSFRVFVRTIAISNVNGCLVRDCRTPTAFGIME